MRHINKVLLVFSLVLLLATSSFANNTATGVALDQARILASTIRTITNAFWADYTDQLRSGTAPLWTSFSSLNVPVPDGIVVDDSEAVGIGGDSNIYFEITSDFAPSNVMEMAVTFLPLSNVEGDRIKVPLVRPGADLSGIELDLDDYVRRDALGRDGTTSTPTFDEGRTVRLGTGSRLVFQGAGRINFSGGAGQINNVYSIGQSGRSYVFFESGYVRVGSAANPSDLRIASGTLIGTNASFSGNVSVAGTLTAPSLSVTNALSIAGTLTAQNLVVPGTLTARGNLVLQGTGTATAASLRVTGSATLPGTLTIAGRTGATSAQAYNVWVSNAVHATSASSGALKFSDDARTFTTFAQVRDAVAVALANQGWVKMSGASNSSSGLFDEIEKKAIARNSSSKELMIPIQKTALHPGESVGVSDFLDSLKGVLPEEHVKGVEVELYARGGTLSWEDLGKVKSGSAPVEERKTLRLDDLKPRTISFTPLFPDGEGEVRIIGIWVDEKYAR